MKENNVKENNVKENTCNNCGYGEESACANTEYRKDEECNKRFWKPKKELKLGDKVEVLTEGSVWAERIFIKYGAQHSVICVNRVDNNDFYNGYYFTTLQYSTWRFLQEIKYRPFTWEERDQLRGKWVIRKDDSFEFLISQLRNPAEIEWWIKMDSYSYYNPSSLLQQFTFLDGSPCGVKEVY